jgi:murein DD-endopeptidase MepM/ murein hydrolase activator NlpD
MKNPFRSVRYTVVMIPEAGQRVVRFRMPRMVLFVMPLLVAALAVSLYLLKDAYDQSLVILHDLEAKLSLRESELTQTIFEKNKEIQRLQEDILALSEEAEAVRDKVESLKKLEAELRGLTGQTDDAGEVTVASALESLSYPAASTDEGEWGDYSIGGLEIPIRTMGVEDIVEETSSEFAALAEEMDGLTASLEDAKEDYIAFQHLMRITPSIWPVASRKITSKFGYRKDPFTGRPSVHSGIDIGSNSGSPVAATADGTVIFAGYDRYAGNNVIIDHSAGIKTRYMHLSKITVKQGQQVQRGDEIGKVGTTGRSTGPHLHYEVIKDGEPVDPRPYMN